METSNNRQEASPMKTEFKMVPQFDVFLSYSSDDEWWVSKLKDALSRYGVSVWPDQGEIRPGDLSDEALKQVLDNCRAVALIVSPAAIASGWVEEENDRVLLLAETRQPPLQIIALILAEAELPDFLQSRDSVDFQDETSYSENVYNLVRLITGERPAQVLDFSVPDSPFAASERGMLNRPPSTASEIDWLNLLDTWIKRIGGWVAFIVGFASAVIGPDYPIGAYVTLAISFVLALVVWWRVLLPMPPTHRFWRILLKGIILVLIFALAFSLGYWIWISQGLQGRLEVIVASASLGAALVLALAVWLRLPWSKLPTRLAKPAGMGVTLLLIFAVAFGLGFRLWTFYGQEPQFEITALNTLDGDENAYELNDNLIWEQNNLDKYGIGITFTLQFVPRYNGTQQYGRVIALISGDGGTLEKTVWNNFEGDSATEEIHLALSEILQLSDLKANTDPPSNLFHSGDIAFQQTKLTVEIARAVDKKSPWDSAEITIRNEPWELRSDLVWRNNEREVDVYLKNLGGTGGFTLMYHLVRLDQEVTSSSHPMLSGTTLIHYWNEPEDLIYLEKSEFFTDTVALPSQLSPGRYLLEIYAVKEQKFVEFKDTNTTWANLKTMQCPWCFAGSGPMRSQRSIFVVTEIPSDGIIQAEWKRLRDEQGIDLGLPIAQVEEVTSSRGTGGRRQVFQEGEIYVHNGQAYALYGPILEHYRELGGVDHEKLGFPVSPIQAVTSSSGTEGSMIEFEGQDDPHPLSVMFASKKGVAATWQWIEGVYTQNGGYSGWLGFPLADEQYYTDSTSQMFENGYVVYHYPFVDGKRDWDRIPVAYPYLASRGTLFDVHAQQLWQDTRIQIRPGYRVTVIQVGGAWTEVGGSDEAWYDANGRVADRVDNNAVLPSVSIGTLIGKIGDDGQIFRLGRWSVLTSPAEGMLYLSMNDLYDYYDDNAGFVTVQIMVEPSD